MTEHVIRTWRLTKRYGEFLAVNDLDLKVRRGEVYGLLGPNGSGKTTTILMLLGLTEPTTGSVQVLGYDPMRQPLQVKSRVGYLPDEVGFYDRLTGRENLIYTSKLLGLGRSEFTKRIDRALEQMGLAEAADNRVGTYSRGMRQRLGVAELLIKRPQVVIMDEPTLGLDPEAAHGFLGTIKELREQGITVLLSSHLLHQVQEVCDRVGLFRHGRMLLEGTVRELAEQVLGGGYRIELQVDGPDGDLQRQLQRLPGVTALEMDGADRLVLKTTDDLRPQVAQAVVRSGGRLFSLDLDRPSLDEVYAKYFEEVAHAQAA
ncbi:MAG: ABC transporter ATP-binding protein [Anaerolineae bacterium]|nr:MAG: ABC transporter ATP-binding protein [Anaerolineae bacterium]